MGNVEFSQADSSVISDILVANYPESETSLLPV